MTPMNLKDISWWVSFRDPLEIWKENPTYLIYEYSAYFLAFLTLSHALRKRGRFPYLWLSIVLHGLTVESVSYFVPDIDNFWHGHSSIILLGKRLPLHIVFFYPILLYPANVAVSKLHLSKLAEPFAVGLSVVLLDVPFDIMGIKLMWWTWHDTDPNIYDRHYWVPWTSYYFHATFACGFSFLFNGSRRLLTRTQGFVADGFFKEFICCIIVGLFSMPLGVMQFLPVYHPLHDNFHLHSEICVLLLLLTYVMIAWTGDRHSSRTEKATKVAANSSKGWFDEVFILVTFHFVMYIVLVILIQPETLQSTGLHEQIGNCNSTSDVLTAFGQILQKKTYLCPTNYDEGYFDWHCLPGAKPPADGSSSYTICGTAYPNRIEYIAVVTGFATLGYYVYVQMLAFSGRLPSTTTKAVEGVATRTRKQKTN